MATTSNNNYRGKRSKVQVHYVTEGNLCRVNFSQNATNHQHQSQPKHQYDSDRCSSKSSNKPVRVHGTVVLILFTIAILTGWLSVKVFAVGVQHFFISDQIKSIEMEEYSSYGQGRWDEDAINEYNRLIDERNNFGTRGIIENWTVSAGSSTFGSIFRFFVYLLDIAWIVLDVVFWYDIGIPFLFYWLVKRQIRLKFPAFKRLMRKVLR